MLDDERLRFFFLVVLLLGFFCERITHLFGEASVQTRIGSCVYGQRNMNKPLS